MERVEGHPVLGVPGARDSDLHIVSDGRRRLIDLTLDEVDQLAAGELRVVGQGQSYQATFKMLSEQMRHFNWSSVADMPLEVITTFAGMLGLVAAPPQLGNYDAGWRGLHREAPEG